MIIKVQKEPLSICQTLVFFYPLLSTINIFIFCHRCNSFLVISNCFCSSSVASCGVKVTRHLNAHGMKSVLEIPHNSPSVKSHISNGLKM